MPKDDMILADIALKDGDNFSVLLMPNFPGTWEEAADNDWCSFALQRPEGSEDPDLVLLVRKCDVLRIVREAK